MPKNSNINYHLLKSLVVLNDNIIRIINCKMKRMKKLKYLGYLYGKITKVIIEIEE